MVSFYNTFSKIYSYYIMKNIVNQLFWVFVGVVVFIALYYSSEVIQEGYSGRKRRGSHRRHGPHRRHRRSPRYYGRPYYHDRPYYYGRPYYYDSYYRPDVYVYPVYNPYKSSSFTDYLRWLFGYPPLQI